MCICICMYVRTNMRFIDQETSLVDTILKGANFDSNNKNMGFKRQKHESRWSCMLRCLRVKNLRRICISRIVSLSRSFIISRTMPERCEMELSERIPWF